MKQLSIAVAVLFFATGAVAQGLSPSLTVERVGTNPIIDGASFSAIGASGGSNINGPSCVRIPDWVESADRADPSAQYYLYFGNHSGDEIRMAWAADLTGPWNIFNMGDNDDPRVAGDGVLDLGPSGAIEFSGGVRVFGHIASPDVEIDEANQRFIMYFHGPANGTSPDEGEFDTASQKTLVATSATGLNFNLPTGVGSGGVGGGETGHGMRNAILGNAYFRTFRYDGELYAFSNYGPIWKAPNAAVPWQTSDPRADAWDQFGQNVNPVYDDLSTNYSTNPGVAPRYDAGHPNPITGAPRHFATLLQEDGHTLEVWYTCRGEQPERIFRTTMDLSQGSWAADTWATVVSDATTVHDEMLRPELDWEGADQPLALSQNGSQTNVNQLRDPELFKDDDGKIYLFYSGEGEEAIGLAEVMPAETTPPTLVSSDIVDDRAGVAVESNVIVTYRVTFSEDIDAGTVDAADFDNADSSTPVIIGSIIEVAPGEFTVEAAPTTTGTLQLRVPTTASIADTSGNLLDSDPAIVDDTIITVTSDMTAPTLVGSDIVDDQSGGAVSPGSTILYTVTFSEDIDESTVSSDDFETIGTAAASIGAIAETSPGVFTVEVTATSSGTLRFRVPTTAVIEDSVGNLFDSDPAVLDDTLIDVVDVQAGAISTWNIARDSSAGSVNLGLDTDSPTFGDGSSGNVNDVFVTGEFGETKSLAVGETFTVTYDITFTGGSDTADQYRFVVGDYGIDADQDWVGGWNFVTNSDLYRARTDGNIQSTGGNAAPLGATKVSSGSFSGDSMAAYTFTFSITRDSSTTVNLEGSLFGGDGLLDQTFTKEGVSTSIFDYNGVGILFGGSSNLDQATLSNARYSLNPVSGPSDYENWNIDEYPGADLSDPQGDYDGDGLSNDFERLFGLDPIGGGSPNPIAWVLDSGSSSATYTRRNPGLTGATYKYEYSTTLEDWTEFTPESEATTDASPVENVTFTLPADLTLPNVQKLFIRVKILPRE